MLNRKTFFNTNMMALKLVFSSPPARGRLEGSGEGSLALLLGPLAPDPVLYPESYSARTPSCRPRIGPNATYILERGQKGVVGDLLKLEGLSITPVPKQSKDNTVADFT